MEFSLGQTVTHKDFGISELEVIRHCLNITTLPKKKAVNNISQVYKRHSMAIEKLKSKGVLVLNGSGVISYLLPNGLLTQNGEDFWKKDLINYSTIVNYL
jgi:hypothetical protein